MKAIRSVMLAASVVLVASIASAVPAAKFAAADVNKDRGLTRAEACAGKTPRVCKKFDAMDRNRDGVVTRAEIRAFREIRRVTKPPSARPARSGD